LGFGHHRQMPAALFTANRPAALFTASRVATTAVSQSAGLTAAHSGHFAPITGGLSAIDTMGEVRPWARTRIIGRRTGRADNSGEIDTA